MATSHDPTVLPDDLPEPEDDGATLHLTGSKLPKITLPGTNYIGVDLSAIRGRTVVYTYPRTGRPDQDLPVGWDAIPGARGCTPQSCSFRDHLAELKASGVAHVFGLSTNATEYQREAAERLHLPFPLISDATFELTEALNLPTFRTSGMRLLKRAVLVIDDGVITQVFYPVFPPDESANEVLSWLRKSRSG